MTPRTKREEKVTVVTTRQDERKLQPRKLTRATASNAALNSPPKLVGAGEVTKAKATKKAGEVEAKEESTKKHRAQKPAAA